MTHSLTYITHPILAPKSKKMYRKQNFLIGVNIPHGRSTNNQCASFQLQK